jgi:SAM-dependent methyltransferase
MLSIRNLVGLIRIKIYFLRLRLKNQGKDAKEVFSDYWSKNHWKNSESKSGDGSTLLYTVHIRREIPLLIKRLQATSMLDAPCGDFNWFKEVKFGQEVNYMGGDIVDGMISELNQKYGSNARKFITLDAIAGKLPDVDIWMCRDLIFHLPTADVFKLIDNFIKSNIKYLLVTSHAASEISNEDTFIGGFRLINLLNPPFSFPSADEQMKDYIEGFPERYLLLYKRETLQAWKKENEQ